MKTKRITKKEAKAFLQLLNKTAAEIGFSEPTGTGASRKAEILTDFGTYTLRLPLPTDELQIDLASGGSAFWFYGRFEDTTQQLSADANPYSGKWNHYGLTAEQACDELRHCMTYAGAKVLQPA